MRGTKPWRILLVEDNSAHAELIERAFEDHFIPNTLSHVSDGTKALDYLYRRGAYGDPEKSPKPQLILLDLRLPKLDGLEVLTEVRANHELILIPVIVFTSSEAEHDVEEAYRRGANSYVVKPLDGRGFADAIHGIGQYWMDHNHYPWS